MWFSEMQIIVSKIQKQALKNKKLLLKDENNILKLKNYELEIENKYHRKENKDMKKMLCGLKRKNFFLKRKNEELMKDKEEQKRQIENSEEKHEKSIKEFEKKESLINQITEENDALKRKNIEQELKLQSYSNCGPDNCSEGNNVIGNTLDFSFQDWLKAKMEMEVTTERKIEVSLFHQYTDGTTHFAAGQSTIERSQQMYQENVFPSCHLATVHPQQICLQQLSSFEYTIQKEIIEEMPQMSETHCPQTKSSNKEEKKKRKRSVSKSYTRKRK